MTNAWHAEARRMRGAGEGLAAIAKKFGVTQQAASLVCKGVVCPIDHNRGRPEKWSSDADKFILEHYGHIKTSHIGRSLGVSRKAVVSRLDRLRQRAQKAQSEASA